jgi:hypothetical protein
LLIREREAVPEHSGTKLFAVAIGEQIEFAKANVVGEPHDGHGSDLASVTHDFEEWLRGRS